MNKIKIAFIIILVIFLTSCQTNQNTKNIENLDEIQGIIHDAANQTQQEPLEINEIQDDVEKMSPDLVTLINDLDDQDVISIFIFMKQIEPDEISELLLTYGIDESIYRDEEKFLDYIYKQYGNDLEQVVFERDRYKTLRLKAIKELTLRANQDFIEKYGIEESQIVYLSSYTTTLIITVPVYQLNLIVQDSHVVEVAPYIEMIEIIE